MKQVIYNLTSSEFNWEISDKKHVRAWGYNNQLPGPVLRAGKGDELVVKFTNNLNEPTMIHWHGLRLPAEMDGTGEVQKPVHPGETFEYRFILPDAGTFWYHSHHNETTQVERGMYGALIVTDENDPVTDNDRVFLLDDMKLNNDNTFTSPKNRVASLIERHDGREGDTLLINGRENDPVKIHAGQVERWRFVNTSNARYITLAFGGREFKMIGNDGGLLEQPVTVNQVMITPGERVDILAGPFSEGDSFPVESLSYSRMTFLKAKKHIYGTVTVNEPKPSRALIPSRLRTIEPLCDAGTKANRKIKLSVGPSLKNGLNFKINNRMHFNDEPVYVGDLQVWEVFNESLMDHPYHLHGFFFQVLSINGKAPAYKSWKDTINLPPRSKVKIAWYADNRPGMWMYHCHILEHHDAGMMANFRVIDRDAPETGNEMMNMTHCH